MHGFPFASYVPACHPLAFIAEENMWLMWTKVRTLFRVYPVTFPAISPSSSSPSSETFHTFIYHFFPVLSCRIFLTKTLNVTIEHGSADLGVFFSIKTLVFSYQNIPFSVSRETFRDTTACLIHDYAFAYVALNILSFIASMSHCTAYLICCSQNLFQCYYFCGFCLIDSHCCRFNVLVCFLWVVAGFVISCHISP